MRECGFVLTFGLGPWAFGLGPSAFGLRFRAGGVESVVTLTTDAADRDALIARARAIRPVLERNAAQTDSLRRLPDDVVGALRDNGLCRLMVPKRFGGSQTSIRTYIEVMAEIGQGCGSTAWVASLINGCEWLAA